MPDIVIVGAKEPEQMKTPEQISSPVGEALVQAAVQQVMGTGVAGGQAPLSGQG